MPEMDENQEALTNFSRAMKHDWDSRAVENAKWFINTIKHEQSDDEFFTSGRPDVEKFVFNDPMLTAELDFKSVRMLEIGCGIGRMTRHLVERFGEVHGTDVSAEMITQARERFQGVKNAFFYDTNGLDFSQFPNDTFDFIFSVYVFQHTPSVEVTRSNIRDACRTLKPGGLFKFQVSSVTSPEFDNSPKDTWTGASFLEPDIRRAARENGVLLVSISGLGGQYCWTLLRKPLKAIDALWETPAIKFFGRPDAAGIKSIPIRSHLMLLVSGLNLEYADANNVMVEIDGQVVSPYGVHRPVGDFSPQKVFILEEGLVQIEVPVPNSVQRGHANVRVRTPEGEWSEAVSIQFLEPQRNAPVVDLVNNAVDAGLDVYATGEKSVFRVFTSRMDDSATAETVRVLVNDRSIKPISVTYSGANGLHMVIARMPELPATVGEVDIRIQFHDLVSEPKGTPILR